MSATPTAAARRQVASGKTALNVGLGYLDKAITELDAGGYHAEARALAGARTTGAQVLRKVIDRQAREVASR